MDKKTREKLENLLEEIVQIKETEEEKLERMENLYGTPIYAKIEETVQNLEEAISSIENIVQGD